MPVRAHGPRMLLEFARPAMLLVTEPAPGKLSAVPTARLKVPVVSASVWLVVTFHSCPPPRLRLEVIERFCVAAAMSIPPEPSASVLPPSDTALLGLVSRRPSTACGLARLIPRFAVEEAFQRAVSAAVGTPVFQLPAVVNAVLVAPVQVCVAADA